MAESENGLKLEEDGSERFRGKTSKQWKNYWQEELESETKRNDEWRREGDEVQRRYLDKRRDQATLETVGARKFRINLFYANTFTQMAHMYGRIPQVECTRRFFDANDDTSRIAANVLKRLLDTSIEEDDEDFTSVMRGNLEDWLVPGMGVAKVRYDYAEQVTEVPARVEVTPLGTEVEIPAYEERNLLWEEAAVDYVHWRDFRWGYGRRWKDIPWVGYDVFLTREEATQRFGPEIARHLTYERKNLTDPKTDSESQHLADPAKTAWIVEIWHKKTNAVFWYHKDYEYLCDYEVDPLGLAGFFPTPKPLVANASTTLFCPTSDFKLTSDLYNEVDQLSTRINIITNAVKVVGVYDKTHGEIKTMLQGSVENDLVPVDNYAMLGEKGGLKGVIDFWPVTDIVEALDKLREMRREAIDLLYQVTGISDILRGMTEQYTGVGTQKIKAQLGSVRIQYKQEEFARYASDLLGLRAEIICKHFSQETILRDSNILQSFDAQDPNLGGALELLKDYDRAKWRVSIKAESMAMIDWTQLKLDRTEFLTALATFLQSAAPIVEQIPGSMPFLLELLKWGLSGYKGGQEVEGVIDRAIQSALENPPEQEDDSPEAGKIALERAKSQAKMSENKQKFDQDMLKQADKARKEMQKMIAQFQTELARIQAETQGSIVEEAAQAHFNIKEKQATERVQ